MNNKKQLEGSSVPDNSVDEHSNEPSVQNQKERQQARSDSRNRMYLRLQVSQSSAQGDLDFSDKELAGLQQARETKIAQKQDRKVCKPQQHRECDEEEKMPRENQRDAQASDDLYDNLKNDYLQLLVKFMEDTQTIMSVSEAEKIVNRSVYNHLQHKQQSRIHSKEEAAPNTKPIKRQKTDSNQCSYEKNDHSLKPTTSQQQLMQSQQFAANFNSEQATHKSNQISHQSHQNYLLDKLQQLKSAVCNHNLNSMNPQIISHIMQIFKRDEKNLLKVLTYKKTDDKMRPTLLHLAVESFKKNSSNRSKNKPDEGASNSLCLRTFIEELKPHTPEVIHFFNRPNEMGNTPLMEAVKFGCYQAAELLINEAKVDINHKNKVGNTALHIAVLNEYPDLCQLLIQNGADVLIVNDEQFTCLETAEMIGNAELCSYLEPIIIEAQLWRDKNCLIKIMLNKKRTKYKMVSVGIFREIIKYA